MPSKQDQAQRQDSSRPPQLHLYFFPRRIALLGRNALEQDGGQQRILLEVQVGATVTPYLF